MESFLGKVTVLQPAKEHCCRCFSENFPKLLRVPLLQNTCSKIYYCSKFLRNIRPPNTKTTTQTYPVHMLTPYLSGNTHRHRNHSLRNSFILQL